MGKKDELLVVIDQKLKSELSIRARVMTLSELQEVYNPEDMKRIEAYRVGERVTVNVNVSIDPYAVSSAIEFSVGATYRLRSRLFKYEGRALGRGYLFISVDNPTDVYEIPPGSPDLPLFGLVGVAEKAKAPKKHKTSK